MEVRIKRKVLARLMAARNISQNRWAQVLGISRAYLSMLLNGQRDNPGPAIRRKLLEALDVSFDQLFEVSDPLRSSRGIKPRLRLADRAPSPRPASSGKGDNSMNILEDLRFSARILMRSPGFVAVAVLTLALGIGVTTAMFSASNTLLWKPLPFPDDRRLLFLSQSLLERRHEDVGVSYLTFVDWRTSAKSFESMAAYDTTALILRGAEGFSERINGVAVSGEFFQVLQVPAQLGRWFADGETDVGVLGDNIWQTLYGGDPGIVGRSILLDGRPTTIVGVMPPAFRFPERHDIWVPLRREASWEIRGNHWLDVVARLQPQAGIGEARLEMQELMDRLREAYPESYQAFGLFMLPFREENVGQDDQLLIAIMMGVTLLVLLIACVNVTHLSLARTSVRVREMAIRSALGAGRARLLRQLLTESWLLAVAGGVLGLFIGKWIKDVLVYWMPDELPYWMDFSMDWRVYLFALGITLLSGVLFGLAPAMKASLSHAQASLQPDPARGTSQRGGRMRGILVATEVALTTILLTGSALLMQTYLNTNRVDLGFDPDGVLTFRTYLMEDEYQDEERRIRFYDQATAEIGSLPGVETVTAASWLPLQGFAGAYLRAEGEAREEGQRLPVAAFFTVTANYFNTVRTPILEGRDFQPEELTSDSRVAVVNQRLAHRFWPQESALGRRIAFGQSESARWVTIVGIVGDAHVTDRREESMMAAYVPHSFFPDMSMSFLVRSSSGDPHSLLPAIRARLQALDPNAAIARIQGWRQIVDLWNWEETFFGWIFGLFSALALGLASVGLYGVVAYSVSQRRHEIGIRMAVGAHRRDVLRSTFISGMRMAVIGIAIGMVGALAFAQALESLLVGVSPGDTITLLMTAILLGLVTGVATWIPAQRAARTDPIAALREE